MTRRSPRWRAPPPKVLSLPTSKHVELCYGFEGKAYIHLPVSAFGVEFVLVDEQRRTRWVPMSDNFRLDDAVDEDCTGWWILGWRFRDGMQRHGEYDAVDPELADLERLRTPNTLPTPWHSTPVDWQVPSPPLNQRESKPQDEPSKGSASRSRRPRS
jgi:hypothetical protein